MGASADLRCNFRLADIGTGVKLPGAAPIQRLVVPFAELSDQDLEDIDLHDGYVDDWLRVVGEPALTAQGAFVREGMIWRRRYDATDLDFRTWLAWHDATDRVYVAMERQDDVFVNDYDRSAGSRSLSRQGDWFHHSRERQGGRELETLWLRRRDQCLPAQHAAAWGVGGTARPWWRRCGAVACQLGRGERDATGRRRG